MTHNPQTGFRRSVTKRFYAGIGASLALLFWLEALAAQSLRDPTLPPAQTATASPAARDKLPSGLRGPLTVVVRDGRNYVVLGTRLYAQGQSYGETRIELVTETEVWFMEKGVTSKIARYPGVQRQAAATPPALPVRAPNSPDSASATP
jgi:hypothetical protein